jgi:glycosyltransferase involved in cell wall biosynthesis
VIPHDGSGGHKSVVSDPGSAIAEVERVSVCIVVQNQGVPPDPRVGLFVRALVGAGLQVEVIAPGSPGQSSVEEVDGAMVRRFQAPKEWPGVVGYAWQVIASVVRIARVRRSLECVPAVVHFCNPPDVLWLPFFFGPRPTVFVFDQHDVVPELYLAKGGRPGSIAHRILQAMERFSYRIADYVIVPNDTYAAVARSRGKVTASRIRVVRNAPRSDRWFPVEPDVTLRSGCDVAICFVGSMGTQDGIEDLVRAIAWVRKTDPSRRYRCFLAGTGDGVEAATALASVLAVQDSLVFLGWVSNPDTLRRIVASADIAVEPCQPNEFNRASTMIKLMDYLAMGRAVVAYDLPEHRVTLGEAGLLVDPELGPAGLGERIVALAKDSALRVRLQERAARRLDEAGFSDVQSRAAVVDAYRSIAALAVQRQSAK